MQRISGAQLKDIRVMKKHHTYAPVSSQSQIRRAPLTTLQRSDPRFLINDQLHEKHMKIKNFDEKLEAHRNEIEKNNEMINQLIKNLENLKDQLGQQTQLTETEQKKCKQLRDELERTNRLLKNKNAKIDELSKKIEGLEKENQQVKTSMSKSQELTKNLQAARRQSLNLQKALQEVSSDKKALAKDKDFQILHLKEQLQIFKAKAQLNDDLRRSLESKDHELHILRTENSNMLSRFEKESQQKQAMKINYETIKKQLDILIENQKSHLAQEKQRQEERKQNDLNKQKLRVMNIRLEQMKSFQSRMRSAEIQAAQLKVKNAQRLDAIEHNKYLYEKNLDERNGIIENLNSKIGSCQKQLQSLKKDLSLTKKTSTQLQSIRNKSDQLQTLYSSLLPPMQCNFCHHSLIQPITVIPCGHNFCLNCKKGYTKCCSVCGEKVKIEAVYRNELLDDIAQLVKNIKELINLVR